MDSSAKDGSRRAARRPSRVTTFLQSTANSLSYWSEPVKQNVQAPGIHLLAIALYAIGMAAYCVFAAIDFANYPTPTIFESAEANAFAPVPLVFDIDCQDCRVAAGVAGQQSHPGVPAGWVDKKTLWILKWDYTALPGGCAARAPQLFSAALRDFCAAQNGNGNGKGSGAGSGAGAGAAATPHDALDKCTIKNTDLPLLRNSKSPDPRLAPTANVSWRRGWGGNPNYGNGSRFELLHAVPLCFVGENAATAAPGLALKIINIPHHAFAAGTARTPTGFIGRAVVALSTPDDAFRERRAFQPWHKNTLHLGLAVDRAADKTVVGSPKPFFSNYQYDGRVEWGKEEGDEQSQLQSHFRDRVLMANALTEHETKVADAAIFTGLLTLAPALNATRTAAGTARLKRQLAVAETKLPPGFLQVVDRLLKQGIAPGDVFQFIDPQNADLTSPIQTRQRRLRVAAAPDGGGGGGDGEPGQRGAVGGLALELATALAGQPSFEEQPPPQQQLGGEEQQQQQEDEEEERRQHSGRRRLSGHDEWGGVEYSVRLAHYASVYTAGRKPTAYEVLASVGGASSSLIGMIGLLVAGSELATRCRAPRSEGAKGRVRRGGGRAQGTAAAAAPAPAVDAGPVAAADVELGLQVSLETPAVAAAQEV